MAGSEIESGWVADGIAVQMITGGWERVFGELTKEFGDGKATGRFVSVDPGENGDADRIAATLGSAEEKTRQDQRGRAGKLERRWNEGRENGSQVMQPAEEVIGFDPIRFLVDDSQLLLVFELFLNLVARNLQVRRFCVNRRPLCLALQSRGPSF